MTDVIALKAANARRWGNAKLTREFSSVAERLVAPAARIRYEAVAAKTKVPWFAIAVIHERECSQNWSRSLAQGDRWDELSVHVPSGRGPFKSWEEAAIDALANCPPHFARNTDWTISGTLAKLEEYNGLGYAARQLPSPYIWSGTDQYRSGKYVRDGVYDPVAVDNQLGCAGLLRAMIALDPSISVAISPTLHPTISNQAPSSRPKPSLANPTKGSIAAFVAKLFATIFERK